MPQAERIAVGTTAVVVADARRSSLTLVTNRSAHAVYLGGSDVTVGAGYELPPGASMSARLTGHDKLYAIAADANNYVHVLR